MLWPRAMKGLWPRDCDRRQKGIMDKILVVTERFWPEEFLVNDFVRALMERGHAVEVLTQVPSYPFDTIYDGYENNHLQTTYWEGVPIHRVNTWFGYNKSTARKILNYLHFAWRTFWWAVLRGRRYDRVIVVHTAALTMASPVYAMKLLWRRHIAIWTQDLWPDAVWGYGIRKTAMRERILNCFVRSIYACCDRIAVSCPSYVGRIREICGRTAEFIPQWEPDAASLQQASHVDHLPSKRIFMFAGNLGVPQNVDNDIDGFLRANVPNAELWILGGGVRYEELKARYDSATRRTGDAIVRFLGRKPRSEMPKWFANADAMVISLTREYAATLPGKFQCYIAAGKPLLGIIEGATAEFIREYGLGVVARPDDVDSIAEGFREMCRMDLTPCGRNARALSEKMFNREIQIGRLLEK